MKGMNVDGKRKQTNFENKIKDGVKLHTVRWDEKNRWQTGKKIHFATGVRTSRYNCFKEGECKGVQKIAIENNTVYIDDRQLSKFEIEEFAINDGFDNVSDFWAWFNSYQPFTGKIIHWTELTY